MKKLGKENKNHDQQKLNSNRMDLSVNTGTTTLNANELSTLSNRPTAQLERKTRPYYMLFIGNILYKY